MFAITRPVAICAALVVLLAAGCSENLTDEQYLERAEQYVSDNKPQAAVVELKNALQQNRDNMQARMLLGQLYLRQGDLPSAEKELLRVREADGALERGLEAAPVLAEVWRGMGKNAEVLAISPEGLSATGQARILATKALINLDRKQLERAGELADNALELAPDSVAGLYAKAQVLAVQQQYGDAQQVVQKLLAIESTHAPAWKLSGELARLAGDPAAAERAYSKAIALDDRVLDYRLLRVYSLIQLDRLDDAQKELDVLTQRAPSSASVAYAQGLVYYQREQFQQAISAFVVAESEKFRIPEVSLYLALSHLRLGNSQQAYVYAQEFYAVQPEHPVGARLMANMWVNQGKPRQAELLASQLLQKQPDDVELLNILANALISQQRFDDAINVLATVAKLEPDSQTAQVRLGAGYLSAGRTGEAVDLVEQAIALDPASGQADTMLVYTHLKAGELDEALQAAKEYQRRNPKDAHALNLLGRVYLSRDDNRAARESFKYAIKVDPNNPGANYNLAALAYSDGDTAAAREFYLAALEGNKDWLPALYALAALEGAAEKFDAMVAYLERATAAHPEELRPRLTLARYYLVSGQANKVREVFADIPASLATDPSVLELVARAQLLEKDYPAARYTLEQIVRQGGASAEQLRMLAGVQQQTGDTAAVQETLEAALEADPDSVPVRIALAKAALSRNDEAEFRQQLTQLQKLDPQNNDVVVLRATLARKTGDQDQALALLQAAYDARPDLANLANLQAQLSYMGRDPAVVTLLEQWIAQHADDTAARLMLASNREAAGDGSAAMKQYDEILKRDPANVVALNNKAWALRTTQPAQALKFARRARESSGDSPAVLDTLAMVLSSNGEHEEAIKTVRGLLRSTPDDPTILYHSAVIEAAAGKTGGAAETLRKLLASDAEFADRDEAERLLARIGRG